MAMKLQKRSTFGWGPTAARSAHPTNGLVVHFDGSKQGLASKAHSACTAYWKNTRKFHMGPERGWLDIGYSFMVCPHGYVLEGRGVNHEQAAQPGGNTTWYSCTFGSGPGEKPNAAQLQAFRDLRAWLRSSYGVGAAVTYHGKFISTDCPGTVLKAMVLNGSIIAGAVSTKPAPVPTATKAPGFPGIFVTTETKSTAATKAEVKVWQAQMKKRGWTIIVDGVYGAQSESVLERFQKQTGLKVDGVLGPESWSKSWSAPIT
jgi:hypothetical protein